MIIGSHNAWSYLKAKHWWMRPFQFMAKCQDVDIKTQYEKYGVRCFDLRIKFDKNGRPQVAHGYVVYDINEQQIVRDLNYLNNKGDCYVRILLEIRKKKEYTKNTIHCFERFCELICHSFANIKFWCGRNLYNWEVNYVFNEEPSCEEKYASVMKPRIIDDWYPRIYAKLNNKRNIKLGTDKDILLIDFVNYV